MQFELMLINVDATLFDVVTTIHKVYRNLAKRDGLALPASFLDRIVDARGSSKERLDREFYRLASLREEADVLIEEAITEKILKDQILSDNAETFLRYLNENRIPYGFVSSMSNHHMDRILKKYPFLTPVIHLTQSEVLEGKPEPDLYLKACRKANVHPNQVLVVENSTLGVTSAFLARTTVVFIESVTTRNEDEAYYSFQEFEDLNQLMLQIEPRTISAVPHLELIPS